MDGAPGRHRPQRRCIGCGRTGDKASLVRIVAGDGGIVIDMEQREPGRGAYLCRDARCIRRAVERGMIARALRIGSGMVGAAGALVSMIGSDGISKGAE